MVPLFYFINYLPLSLSNIHSLHPSFLSIHFLLSISLSTLSLPCLFVDYSYSNFSSVFPFLDSSHHMHFMHTQLFSVTSVHHSFFSWTPVRAGRCYTAGHQGHPLTCKPQTYLHHLLSDVSCLNNFVLKI